MPRCENVSRWIGCWRMLATSTSTPFCFSTAVLPICRGLRAQHRRGAFERAVAQRNDGPGTGLRRLACAGKPAADRDVEMRAEPAACAAAATSGVVQDADHGALRALRQQFGDDAGGVGRRAGARIVLRVGEDDRLPRGRRNADRVRDRFGNRLHALRREGRLGGNHRIGHD